MKNIYRNIGIGLLLASILIFIKTNSQLILFLSLFDFYVNPLKGLFWITGESIYESSLIFIKFTLGNTITIWAFIISIILIRKNKYTKQLLYLVYSIIIMQTLSFLLAIPLKKFLIFNLIIATLIYIFLIYKNNKWSKIITNKK
jgi:hypothetical protein